MGCLPIANKSSRPGGRCWVTVPATRPISLRRWPFLCQEKKKKALIEGGRDRAWRAEYYQLGAQFHLTISPRGVTFPKPTSHPLFLKIRPRAHWDCGVLAMGHMPHTPSQGMGHVGSLDPPPSLAMGCATGLAKSWPTAWGKKFQELFSKVLGWIRVVDPPGSVLGASDC